MLEKTRGLRFWRSAAYKQMQVHLPVQDHLPWYQLVGLRLKEYVLPYYERLGRRELNEVSAEEIRQVVDFYQSNLESLDKDFLIYVGKLLLAVKGEANPGLFQGLTVTCGCGGLWTLSRRGAQVKDWQYNCNHCHLTARVDVSGLPISLPAPESVRVSRVRMHKRLTRMVEDHESLKPSDVYIMLSYCTGVPMIYTHFGLLQTDEAVELFSQGLDKVDKMLDLVADGVDVDEALQAVSEAL
ncbi:hypothetical protein ACP3V3_02155 [Vibrio sp. PNB22_3_1]